MSGRSEQARRIDALVTQVDVMTEQDCRRVADWPESAEIRERRRALGLYGRRRGDVPAPKEGSDGE